MQVYKLCIKILKKNLPSMMIYLGLFILLSILISSSSVSDGPYQSDFVMTKRNIALICEEESPLIDGLKQELQKVATFVELKDDREALQDALFFQSVTYILRVPEGFTERFMNHEMVQLDKMIIPNTYTNAYFDLYIDQYFNTARFYISTIDNLTQEELVSYVQRDLAVNAEVDFQQMERQTNEHLYSYYYFNYLSYSLLSVLVLGMSSLMVVFNNNELKRRNACAPLSRNRVNLQFILAALSFTLVAWLLMLTFCFAFNYQNSLNMNSVFYILNSFVFAICATSISYLVGNLIRGRNAIPAVCNVLSLGSCFLSGVFVPQEFLGSFVLKIASFTPTYWYVKANTQIALLTHFDYAHLAHVLPNILIQAGFAIAFFAIALVVGKRRYVN